MAQRRRGGPSTTEGLVRDRRVDPRRVSTSDGRLIATFVEPGRSDNFKPFWLVEGPDAFEAVVGSLEAAEELLVKRASRRTRRSGSFRGSADPELGGVCDGSGTRVPLSPAEASAKSTHCNLCHRTFVVRVGRGSGGWPAATLPKHKAPLG